MDMETIWDKIKKAVEKKCPDVVYEENYPKDRVFPKCTYNKDIEDIDEDEDTITPMVKAMAVIMGVVRAEATVEDDIEVVFAHLPGEETWVITIGDGR